MRKNLFLHFMNRDTREIMRVYDVLDRDKHSRALRGPINLAAMLCEEFCVAPPGFVIEDDISFELFEAQFSYLETGLFRLPIRERSLADFAEKKRGEYAPARSRYSGLFDDSRLQFLSSFGSAIVQRQVKIGPAIADGFKSGVDTRASSWKLIRSQAPSAVIEEIRQVPSRLAEEGKALTWSIMQPHLTGGGVPLHGAIRDALQHTYFREYCREFDLIVLSDLPYLYETFHLPTERSVYSFRRFKAFLDSTGAGDIFLSGSAAFIMRMRAHPGFQELMDAYVGLARAFRDETDMRYHASRAVSAAKYDWRGLSARRKGLFDDPTVFESVEIADACAELAELLTDAHGLPTRISKASAPSTSLSTLKVRSNQLTVVIFVALEEELKVLQKSMSLTLHHDQPVGRGSLDNVDVHVICPRSMGRVPAAVAMTRYLASSTPPSIIFCVGLAGGFKEAGVDPGCVICAETVVDLANRKVTDSEQGTAVTKFRRQDFGCNRSLYNFLRSDEFKIRDWESHCRDNFDWPEGRLPHLKEGKIASVDEVISSDDQRARMVASEDKLLGVEMEAGGVCAAAREFGIPVYVLRVVSDMADPSKADDNWRALGMKTLADLLKRMPLKRVIEVAGR